MLLQFVCTKWSGPVYAVQYVHLAAMSLVIYYSEVCIHCTIINGVLKGSVGMISISYISEKSIITQDQGITEVSTRSSVTKGVCVEMFY